MASETQTILFDFNSDTISNTTATESLGLALMRLAAKSTRSMDYTGLSHINRLVRNLLPSRRFVRTRIFDDTEFEFPYGDGYWGCLLDNAITYSPSEELFLNAIADVDYAFIDCGANFGYMSSIVSSNACGKKSAIAIEADPDTFKMLERNWILNNQRFDLMHNAVFSKSGEWVDFGGGKHEARSIQEGKAVSDTSKVETIKLDDLAPWIDEQNCEHLVMKLDVEGVEIEALKGAGSLMKSDPCIMFEDHGADTTHEVSRFIKHELGMGIYFSDEEGCREIKSLDELADIKHNPRVGYDFLAARGDFWPELISNLKYG